MKSYFKGSPVDSILEAVFTVSPKRQNLGIFRPTTPEHTGPLQKIYIFFLFHEKHHNIFFREIERANRSPEHYKTAE